MAISGIGSSYNQIEAATNYVQEKTTAKEAGRKMAEQPVRLSISNDGSRKLTKDEELDALDVSYKKTVDSFVTMEQMNQRGCTIIGEEAEKIAKISRRETKAADFLKEQKARGTDKVPENLNEKMLSAVASFKEKYAAFNPNAATLSQLLAGIKISQ